MIPRLSGHESDSGRGQRLAALFHRWEEFHFERCLYVVGGDQRLHFRQLEAVLQRMDLEWEPRVEHVAFGMLRLPEGEMSRRMGRVVFLEDVLARARDEALRIIREKNPELPHPQRIAGRVGVGAVLFDFSPGRWVARAGDADADGRQDVSTDHRRPLTWERGRRHPSAGAGTTAPRPGASCRSGCRPRRYERRRPGTPSP